MTAETTCTARSEAAMYPPTQQTYSRFSAYFRCQYLHGAYPKRDLSPVGQACKSEPRVRQNEGRLFILLFPCDLNGLVNQHKASIVSSCGVWSTVPGQSRLEAGNLLSDTLTNEQRSPLVSLDTDESNTQRISGSRTMSK